MHSRARSYSHFLNKFTDLHLNEELVPLHLPKNNRTFSFSEIAFAEIVHTFFLFSLYVNRCRCPLLTKHHRNKAYEFKSKLLQPVDVS